MINNSLAGNKIETLAIEEGIKTLGSGTEIFLANHKIKFPTSKERDTHEGPRGSEHQLHRTRRESPCDT